MKWLLFVLAIVYVASPVDFLPGPIDDALVTVAAAGLTAIVAMFENPEGKGG